MEDVEEPEPPQQPAMANGLLIRSEMRRVIELEPRRRRKPPGPGPIVIVPRRTELVLVLRLAMTECHTWLGIGGRSDRVHRPRRFSRDASLALDLNHDGCRRRLIGRAIKHSLRDEEEYRHLTPSQWDQAVPADLERALTFAAAAASYEARVDISVRFEFRYSEPKALLLECYEHSGGDLAGRSGNGGGGGGDGDGGGGEATASCAICFEEMSPSRDEVTGLPGCTHGFHRLCIGAWFHKASTCPVCRRDQRRYLPKEYRDLHDVMTRDPDGCLPDYL